MLCRLHAVKDVPCSYYDLRKPRSEAMSIGLSQSDPGCPAAWIQRFPWYCCQMRLVLPCGPMWSSIALSFRMNFIPHPIILHVSHHHTYVARFVCQLFQLSSQLLLPRDPRGTSCSTSSIAVSHQFIHFRCRCVTNCFVATASSHACWCTPCVRNELLFTDTRSSE